MSEGFPYRMGSLARSPTAKVAEKVAKNLVMFREQLLVVTVDHKLGVWIELPGHEIEDERCGYYDTSRHWMDLAKQLAGDLLARKQELLPDRADA